MTSTEAFSTTSFADRIDVRQIEPHDRHPTIFASFGRLAPGQSLELVNDHDPQPLHRQFELLNPTEFAWTYLERGPVWRVAIARVRPAAAANSCCGGCGGGH